MTVDLMERKTMQQMARRALSPPPCPSPCPPLMMVFMMFHSTTGRKSLWTSSLGVQLDFTINHNILYNEVNDTCPYLYSRMIPGYFLQNQKGCIMTIYDIAPEAGVLASTVSRVINNRPGINPATRQKVEKLLLKYDFQPNASAKGLVEQSSKIIGVLMSD